MNTKINFLFNPFTRVAGWKSLWLGLAISIITILVGTFSKVVFDGVIDIHLVPQTNILNAFSCFGISYISLALIMSLGALILTKKFRIIDIFGTMLLSKAPLILAAIAGFFTTLPNVETIQGNPMALFSSISFIVVTILILPISIWSIALSYNALKVSTGTKGGKLIGVFIAGLLIAEIVSKVLLSIILK